MRTIKLGQIGGYAEDKVNELLRETVLTVDRKLKKKSPVDTGRFRMSWQVGENTSGGGKGIGPVGGGIPKIDKLNYSVEKVGNTYSIHSNLPYSERLAAGHSDQAPAGWVDLVAKEEAARVKRNWDRIVRKN